MRGPKLLCDLQLLVRGGCRHDGRARGDGDLQTEDRETAGALHKHDISALEGFGAEEGVVCGKRGAGEIGGFIVGEVLGNTN